MTEPGRVVRERLDLLRHIVKDKGASVESVAEAAEDFIASLPPETQESRDGLREELKAIHALVVKGLGEDTEMEWELTEARDRLAALAESPECPNHGKRPGHPAWTPDYMTSNPVAGPEDLDPKDCTCESPEDRDEE